MVAAVAGVTGTVADVAAEVTAVAAEVTVEVADVTADVGKLAACACRESDSKTVRMPTAKIATCTARRAMCRNIGWGTSRSRPVGTGLTQAVGTDLTKVPTTGGSKPCAYEIIHPFVVTSRGEFELLRIVAEEVHRAAVQVIADDLQLVSDDRLAERTRRCRHH